MIGLRPPYSSGRSDGSFFQRINWGAVGIALLLEGLLVVTFIQVGIVRLSRPEQPKVTVMELLPIVQSQAAAQEAPPEQPEDPVIQQLARTELVAPPEIETEIIAPTPEVVVAAPTPIQATTQVLPVDPVPAAASDPAPAAAPVASGPVNVPNLGASLVKGTPPRYPVESRRKREQGTVVLRLVISEQGRVTDIVVHKSSGFPLLDNAALEAVRRWRWSPLYRDGRAVEVTGLVQIPFILKES